MDARVKPAHDERIVLVTAPALQRTAPQELRAALRPGHVRYFGASANALRIRAQERMPL
jgi:hypothetical protein